MKKYNVSIVIIAIIAFYIFMLPSQNSAPVEQCTILSGVGIDLLDKSEEGMEYDTTLTSYIFNKQNDVSVEVIKGTARNFALLKENLERDNNLKYVYGHEKVLLIGEEYARSGIRDCLDKYFSVQDINDLGWVAVCKGKAADILKTRGNEFTPAGEFMDKLIKYNLEDNFFADDCKLIDIFVRLDGEGRSIVLPYIEIKDGRITITGIAVFNKDKMVKNINISDARIINCLRNNESKGQFLLEEGIKKYTAISGNVKRKVECEKKDDKLNFKIKLDFTGDVITNLIYTDIMSNPNTIKEFEGDISKQVEKKIQAIYDKTKDDNDYLELGVIAASKYGRRKENNWGERIKNSNVKVEVNVHVKNLGQGQYNEKTN